MMILLKIITESSAACHLRPLTPTGDPICRGLTLLIDKYVDAKVQNKTGVVKRAMAIDISVECNALISNLLDFVVQVV